MRTRGSWAARGLIAVGAAGGLALASGGGSPATAQDTVTPTAPAKTISMRSTARRLFFTGATTVKTGQLLRIRNLSDPRQHGPHTFTLVAANYLPRSRRAQGDECFEKAGRVCQVAAMAHQINPRTFRVGKQLVEAGRPGWDKRFSRTSRTGDSWFSEKEDEEFQQVVSARAGTVLRYLCIVHPNMQGRLRVTN